MFRNLSARVTGRNRFQFVAIGYGFIIFSWILAPAILVFVASTSAFTTFTGQDPFDGSAVPLTQPRWESLGSLLLACLSAAGLLYSVGRFGARYVATVKAGQRPWPWPSEPDPPAGSG